jgi:hypothetical protein
LRAHHEHVPTHPGPRTHLRLAVLAFGALAQPSLIWPSRGTPARHPARASRARGNSLLIKEARVREFFSARGSFSSGPRPGVLVTACEALFLLAAGCPPSARSARRARRRECRAKRGTGWVGIVFVMLREAPGYVACGCACATALTNAPQARLAGYTK